MIFYKHLSKNKVTLYYLKTINQLNFKTTKMADRNKLSSFETFQFPSMQHHYIIIIDTITVYRIPMSIGNLKIKQIFTMTKNN